MLLLSTSVLLAAVVVAGARGGRLTHLARHRWQAPALPLVALGLQIVAFLPDETASAATRVFAATVHLLSYGLVLGFAWANRRTPWVRLIAVGIALNVLAIVANGGFMPVSPGAAAGTAGSGEAVARGIYNNSIRMSADTRLSFLGDVFRMPAWFPLPIAFSAGDLLISVGAFALVQRLTGAGRS